MPKKINNELAGISAEYAICQIFELDGQEDILNRVDEEFIRQFHEYATIFTPLIEEAMNSMPEIVKYVGLGRGKGQEKSPIDFMTNDNQSISIKTNIKGDKQCPSRCGQAGSSTFDKFFGHLYPSNFNGKINFQRFEQLFREQFHQMLPIYLENLFDCNYMLWIFKQRNNWKYRIIQREAIQTNYNWNIQNFTFSHTNRDWLSSGEISSTVRFYGNTGHNYNIGRAPNSLGELQVHSNRAGYKFRLFMSKYLRMFGLL